MRLSVQRNRGFQIFFKGAKAVPYLKQSVMVIKYFFMAQVFGIEGDHQQTIIFFTSFNFLGIDEKLFTFGLFRVIMMGLLFDL